MFMEQMQDGSTAKELSKGSHYATQESSARNKSQKPNKSSVVIKEEETKEICCI